MRHHRWTTWHAGWFYYKFVRQISCTANIDCCHVKWQINLTWYDPVRGPSEICENGCIQKTVANSNRYLWQQELNQRDRLFTETKCISAWTWWAPRRSGPVPPVHGTAAPVLWSSPAEPRASSWSHRVSLSDRPRLTKSSVHHSKTKKGKGTQFNDSIY